jgi:putative transposase
MQHYPTDLTDSQWQIFKSFLNAKRKRATSLRSVCNAIFYVVKSGCQWRMLPRHYPPWQTVYYYFQMW